MDNKTVFIVGCARTGSTLLRQILNKSPRVSITPETHFLRRFGSMGWRKILLKFDDLSHDGNVEKLVAYIYSDAKIVNKGYWRWLQQNVDRRDFERRLLASDRSERAIFTLLLTIYAEEKRGAITPELIMGEKTPTHLYYVPTLVEWFPNSKIIHTFRDPRAIFTSTLRRVKAGRWGPKAALPFLPSWLIDPLLDPFEVLNISRTWRDAVHLHTKYQHMYGQRYHLVRFEDLITDPHGQLEAVCAFLDMPFEQYMLDEVNIIGSSFYDQRHVSASFDPHAADRWKEHIHPLANTWFSITGRRHLEKFGYTP